MKNTFTERCFLVSYVDIDVRVSSYFSHGVASGHKSYLRNKLIYQSKKNLEDNKIAFSTRP